MEVNSVKCCQKAINRFNAIASVLDTALSDQTIVTEGFLSLRLEVVLVHLLRLH